MEQYIQPFIDVCVTVFKEFLSLDLKAGRPFFSVQDAINDWDVSSIIGLTGEARGAVVISMKKELVIKITDILTGSKHTELDDEVLDTIGEIVNIIAGNAKKGLEEDFRLVISLPTIVKGKQHSIKWSNASARIVCIPFTAFENDVFNLSVAIEAVSGGGAYS
jgi:chemotaxis protein CheX